MDVQDVLEIAKDFATLCEGRCSEGASGLSGVDVQGVFKIDFLSPLDRLAKDINWGFADVVYHLIIPFSFPCSPQRIAEGF